MCAGVGVLVCTYTAELWSKVSSIIGRLCAVCAGVGVLVCTYTEELWSKVSSIIGRPRVECGGGRVMGWCNTEWWKG